MYRSIQLLIAVSLVLSLVAVGGAGTAAAVGSDGTDLSGVAGGDVVVVSDAGPDGVGLAHHCEIDDIECMD